MEIILESIRDRVIGNRRAFVFYVTEREGKSVSVRSLFGEITVRELMMRKWHCENVLLSTYWTVEKYERKKEWTHTHHTSSLTHHTPDIGKLVKRKKRLHLSRVAHRFAGFSGEIVMR